MSEDDNNENEEGLSDEENEEGEDGEGGGSKKLILIAAAAVVLIIGVGAGLYFTGMLDGLLGKTAAVEGEHSDDGHGEGHGDGDGHGKSASAYFLKVPDMIVNLSTDSEQPRYLKISVELELENEADRDAVQAVTPRVVNQFQTYLRELRVKDLQGSQGMYRLRMELLSRVNAATYPIEVQNVLFQELLVQ